MNSTLLSNVRFYFAQSVFNTTCHRKSYDKLDQKKNFISKMVFGFSAVTIVLLILQVIGLEKDYKSLLVTVAFVGLLLTGGSLLFELLFKDDLASQMYSHKNSAEKYKALRDEYMSLIEEIMSGNIKEDILRSKKDSLRMRYTYIGENAPSTSVEDYNKAQKALGIAENSDEEFTWSNSEIDRFLPQELRLNSQP